VNRENVNGENQGSRTPIFDAMADLGILDPETLEGETVGLDDTADVPPDAAARDAARRREAGTDDRTLHDDEFRFITRGTTDEERAAVIAVLTQVRAEETKRVRRVERREHQPWARSQRVPEGIRDLLIEG